MIRPEKIYLDTSIINFFPLHDDAPGAEGPQPLDFFRTNYVKKPEFYEKPLSACFVNAKKLMQTNE